MTITELEQAQAEIIEEIYSFAERVGLSNDNIPKIRNYHPIHD